MKIEIMNRGIFYNHVKIAFRTLKKNKFYSGINILGLALGLAACVLVFSYVQYESSYDLEHPNVNRLYRVNQTAIWSPDGGIMSSTPPPLANVLQSNYPEIETATRINTPGSKLVSYDNEQNSIITFNEQYVLAADSNFFDFFHFPLKEGNPQTALQGVGKVVLSPKAAMRYFGDQPALGKILLFGEEKLPVQVSGVTHPQANNQHFFFDFLLSMPTNPAVKDRDWSWIWTQIVTYVRLQPNTDLAQLENKMASIGQKFVAPSFGRLQMDFNEFIKDKGSWSFYLQPVKDIHLKSQGYGNRIGDLGSLATVRLLTAIAFFILLIAILNFVNLSTARASTRTKEIGVKKTMGALRSSLFKQFIVESVTLSLLSALIGGILLVLIHQLIHLFAGIDIPIESFGKPSWIIGIIVMTVLVGLLAGIYPAIYLSAFQPIQVLKGRLASGMKNPMLRNLLVTAQFTISIALIAGTILVFQQLKFIDQKDLGFNKENVLVINNAEKLGNQIKTYRDQIKDFPEVLNAAIAMDVPGRGAWEDFYRKEGSDIQLSISQFKVDENYIPTLDFKIKTGRAFEKGRTIDQNSLVINETTARMFEWSNEQAIGQKIIYPGYPDELKVIGVVEDFHYQSLRQEVAPIVFFNIDSKMWGDQRVMALKYDRADEQVLLQKLEASWNQVAQNIPFDYSFFDEEMNLLYAQERSLSGLFAIFSGFSLFIAMIGLIGLLAFSTTQRKKEISVRKVLGASKFQIFRLINKQYVFLFLIAMILAMPLSWQSMQNWLNAFAYRINVSFWVFLLSGGLVIILSLLSVGFLSLKIAGTNPAEVLKDE